MEHHLQVLQGEVLDSARVLEAINAIPLVKGDAHKKKRVAKEAFPHLLTMLDKLGVDSLREALLALRPWHQQLMQPLPLLRKQLAKKIIDIWSSSQSADSVRVAACLALHRLVTDHQGQAEAIMAKMLKSFSEAVNGSIGIHQLGMASFLLSSVAEVMGARPEVAKPLLQRQLRALTQILMQAFKHPGDQTVGAVCCTSWVWRLKLLVRTGSCSAEVAQLLQAALLLPLAPRFYPFHLQLISMAKDTQIILPYLLQILAAIDRSGMGPAERKPRVYDFVPLIRVAQGDCRTPSYLEGVAEECLFYLVDYLNSRTAKAAILPELILPITTALASLKNLGPRLGKTLQTIIERLNQHAVALVKARQGHLLPPASYVDVPVEAEHLTQLLQHLHRVREQRRKLATDYSEDAVPAKRKPVEESEEEEESFSDSSVDDEIVVKKKAKKSKPVKQSKKKSVAVDEDVVEEMDLSSDDQSE